MPFAAWFHVAGVKIPVEILTAPRRSHDEEKDTLVNVRIIYDPWLATGEQLVDTPLAGLFCDEGQVTEDMLKQSPEAAVTKRLRIQRERNWRVSTGRNKDDD